MDMMKNVVLEEWETEPDILKFQHKGMKCLVLRMPEMGHLCGYIRIKELPEEFDEYDYHVHGNITFSQNIVDCSDTIKSYFEDEEYVVGFDASHAEDLVPSVAISLRKGQFSYVSGRKYRNMIYMKEETMKLAEQLVQKNLPYSGEEN